MHGNKVERLANHFCLAFLFSRLAFFNRSERNYFQEGRDAKAEVKKISL